MTFSAGAADLFSDRHAGAWLRPLPGGGSPATVHELLDDNGKRVVVKLMRVGDGLVDGHDLETFRRKPQQIAAVHRDLPALSSSYVRVLNTWDGPDWAAYAMPYCDGAPLCAPLQSDRPEVQRFTMALAAVLRHLTENGYAVREIAPAPSFALRVHIDRVRRRLPLLRSELATDLFAGQAVVVNGRRCTPLPALFNRIAADECLLAALQPASLRYPLHGDLNLGNILVRSVTLDGRAADFTVVDPRGTDDPWDVVYDLAKALFSLTLHERALESGYRILRAASRTGVATYEFGLCSPWNNGYAAGVAGFAQVLDLLPFSAHLDRADHGWRRRLLFTHAFHVAAEAACRLSDRKPRSLTTASGAEASRQLATGLVLAATLLLNDLLEPGRIEGDIALLDHLACLPWMRA